LIESVNRRNQTQAHEGGGKSLEIRRFGFNLDQGGVNGGLKVPVINVPAESGHARTWPEVIWRAEDLTPELVDEFNPATDPSAPNTATSRDGVVHHPSKGEPADKGTVRFQAGRFGSYRNFLHTVRTLNKADAVHRTRRLDTDGRSRNPLPLPAWTNVTGNYTAISMTLRQSASSSTSGAKIFFRARFRSILFDRRLSRFGFIDPSDGGRIRMAQPAF